MHVLCCVVLCCAVLGCAVLVWKLLHVYSEFTDMSVHTKAAAGGGSNTCKWGDKMLHILGAVCALSCAIAWCLAASCKRTYRHDNVWLLAIHAGDLMPGLVADLTAAL